MVKRIIFDTLRPNNVYLHVAPDEDEASMIARILGARNAAIIPDTSSARSLLAALWRCAIEHAPALDAITAALGLALVRAGVRPLSLHGPLLHRAHHNAVGTHTIHGDVELAGDVRVG